MAWFCVGHKAVERDLLAWARRYECVYTYSSRSSFRSCRQPTRILLFSPSQAKEDVERGSRGWWARKKFSSEGERRRGGSKVFWQERITVQRGREGRRREVEVSTAGG